MALTLDFVGRSNERNRLSSALRKKTASLIVIKGRRRIGKSRLIEEFAKDHVFYKFTGLPIEKHGDAQFQRDHFAWRLNQQTGLPEISTGDWSKLFSLLHARVKEGRVIVLLDEITWMAEGDPTFLSKLQSAWENELKKNPQLILVLCGSVSAWIEKNILSSTGYFGRVSIQITLDELPINDCNQLLDKLGFKGSDYEKLMLLNIMGGIPWYLEQLDPGLSVVENIKRLCFIKDGILVSEFKRIFHDLFGKNRYEVHRKIIKYLAQSPAEYEEISKGIAYASGGVFSDYLDELEASGFIQRDYTWSLKSGSTSALSQYRLKDNYLRFYLKYIEPMLIKINRNQFLRTSISTLPGWDSMMGLQVENLVLNNRELIHKALNIDPNIIVQDNPFFQRKTSKTKGCQIDYLIQTKYKTLYVCEIKFSRSEIGKEVIHQVKEKTNRISLPRGYSCIPVLIVVHDVKQSVIDEDYFVRVIDLRELLTS